MTKLFLVRGDEEQQNAGSYLAVRLDTGVTTMKSED